MNKDGVVIINTFSVIDGNGVREYNVADDEDMEFYSEAKKPYPFYTAIAEVYGADEAIVIGKFYEIVHDNSSVKNFIIPHNGWNYIRASLKMMQILFPFFSMRTIRRVLQNLEENDLIHSELLSEKKNDRTKCYCINSKLFESVLNEKERKVNVIKRTSTF